MNRELLMSAQKEVMEQKQIVYEAGYKIKCINEEVINEIVKDDRLIPCLSVNYSRLNKILNFIND